MKLYENIRIRRKELGISQTELAKKMNYANKSMISRIENGKIDLPESKVMAFADALETTASALMGWDDLERIENEYRESVDALVKEFNIMDELQAVLEKDDFINGYKFSDDQLAKILHFARFTKEGD